MRSVIVASATLATALLATVPTPAQGEAPTPVEITRAVAHAVRAVVRVPGTVESPRVSVVAAETAGQVAVVLAREGDVVSEGAGLAGVRTDELDIWLRGARAQLAEARARLDLATRNLDRARDLFASTVIARADLDDAVSEQLAWANRVDGLEADIARVELNLRRAVVRAPFAGVVVREHAEVGEWLDVGDPVAEVQATGTLDVRVPVPERYFAALDRDAGARVTFESIPGLVADGRIEAVVPRAEPQSRAFPLKVRIRRPDPRIAVGMLAEVELRAGEPSTAVLVPKDAVVSSGSGAQVWRVGDDGTVAPIAVRTGAGHGAWVEILEGVPPGARVVVRGNERLRVGQGVRPTEREYALP